MSLPATADRSAPVSSRSASTSLKRDDFNAPSRKRRWPVEKLSYPTTLWPVAMSRSTRLLPMKPAAPVTNACILLFREDPGSHHNEAQGRGCQDTNKECDRDIQAKTRSGAIE